MRGVARTTITRRVIARYAVGKMDVPTVGRRANGAQPPASAGGWVGTRQRDAEICGMRRGGGHNHNAMRHCTVCVGACAQQQRDASLHGMRRMYAQPQCDASLHGMRRMYAQPKRDASLHGIRLDVCTTITQCVITTRRARPGIATQCTRNRARRPHAGRPTIARFFIYGRSAYLFMGSITNNKNRRTEREPR